MTKYYKVVNNEIAAQISALLDDRQAAAKEAKEHFAAETGIATTGIVTHGPGTNLVGIVFAAKPKGWCSIKDADAGCYRPRAKSAAAAKLEGYAKRFHQLGLIKELLGIPQLELKAKGGKMWTLGTGVFDGKGTVYVETDSDKTPKHCERISDMEFEAAKKKASKK